jgi:hypothetical protein
MRTDTQSTTIAVPADRTFDFVSDPANLPRWAIGFAKAVRRGDDGWIVKTQRGEVPIRVEADRRLGVIDFHLTVGPDVEVSARSRVLPVGECSEYVFTQHQNEGMTDEVFDAQVRALTHELVALKAQLEVACPL